MPGIGIGIGIGLSKRKQYWESYLNNNTELLISSRTGTVLTDKFGNNASLLLPTIRTSASSSWADSGVLATENTIWVVRCKINSTLGSRWQGAQSTGNNTRLFFGTGTTDANKINFAWGNTAPIRAQNIANDFDWHLFIVYNKKFWVLDKDTEVTDTSILNIITTVAPSINDATATWSGENATIKYGRLSETYFIDNELSLSFIGTISDNVITWQVKHIFGGNPNYVFNALAEDYITWNNPGGLIHYYSENGANYLYEVGYSQYLNKDNEREIIPLQITGEPYTDPPVTEGYVFYEKIDGNRLYFEDFKIRFQNAFFDRSNTTIYNDNARGAAYDSINPKDWMGYEFNRYFFENSINTAYKYKIFVGYTSKLDNAVPSKIALFDINQLKNKIGLFGYFNDYDAAVTVEQLSLHIDSQNGDKIFGFDATEGTIFYSEDGGENYNTLEFADAGLIGMSYVYSNGHILFLTDTKAYHSVDKLMSIEEISIYDQNGDAFPVVATAKNFINVRYTDHQILGNGKELITFGSYVNVAGNNGYVCLFYSIEGESVKTAYMFGQNATYGGYGDPLNTVIARHIHSSTYSEISGKWYWNTGDNGVDPDFECHIFESTYNYLTDTWSHTKLLSGDASTHLKAGALIAKNGNIYIGSDSTSSPGLYFDRGIFKVDEDNLSDVGKHYRLLDHVHWIISGHLMLNGIGVAFAAGIPYDAGKYKFITYSPRFKYNYNVNVFEQIPEQTEHDTYVAWKLIYVSDKVILANTMGLDDLLYVYNTIKITIL